VWFLEPGDTATATASPTATASRTPVPTTATPLPTLGELLRVEDSYRYRFDIDRVDGECVDRQTAPSQDPGNWTAREAFGNLSLRPVNTTTIDGEEVYVYESNADRPGGFEGPFTIYVSAETGYVLRQESPNVVSETWDWGDVEPVEPPC